MYLRPMTASEVKQWYDRELTRAFLPDECKPLSEIAALMEMSSAAISHHLRRLRACALIVSRREGTEVYYRAADTKEARFLHQMIEDLLDITCPQERRV